MEEVATNTRPPPHSPLGPSSASRHRPPDAAGQPEFVPPCRFRLPPRPSRLKASEGSWRPVWMESFQQRNNACNMWCCH
uniref:Uncharacterized protein n=1 Tax=Oryza punctata TaxID=4537 RepID=A0A0E0JPS0_ORYPU